MKHQILNQFRLRVKRVQGVRFRVLAPGCPICRKRETMSSNGMGGLNLVEVAISGAGRRWGGEGEGGVSGFRVQAFGLRDDFRAGGFMFGIAGTMLNRTLPRPLKVSLWLGSFTKNWR